MISAVKSPSKWLVLLTVVSGTFISALNTSIVNVSIPTLMKAFEAELHQVEWVITAFMIAFCVTMPLTNWLKERLSYRLLFVFSLAVFSFGSFLCGTSDSLEMLIFSRIIQALGGGALAPLSMAIVADTFPPSERGRAFGIWGLGVVIGPAIGPTLGGYLSETFSWHWIFLINIPLSVLAMALGWRYLHRKKLEITHSLPFDFLGFFSITVAIVTLLYGLSALAEKKIYTGAMMLAIALISSFIFVRIEKRARAPLWDLSLFGNKVFVGCILITFVRSVSLFGGIFLLPLFLQEQMLLSETESGLLMLPGSLILAFMMPVTGTLADKGYTYSLTVTGLIILAVSFTIFYVISPNTAPWIVMIILLIRGIGIGLLVTPVSTATMTSVKSTEAAMASSISNVAQQLGGSFGIAILVLLKAFFFGAAVHHGQFQMQADLTSLHLCFLIAGIIVLLSLLPARNLRNLSR